MRHIASMVALIATLSLFGSPANAASDSSEEIQCTCGKDDARVFVGSSASVGGTPRERGAWCETKCGTPTCASSGDCVVTDITTRHGRFVADTDRTVVDKEKSGACATCAKSAESKPVEKPGFWSQLWACEWSWCFFFNCLKVLLPLLAIYVIVMRKTLAVAWAEYGRRRALADRYRVIDPDSERTRDAEGRAWESLGTVGRICWWRRHSVARNGELPSMVADAGGRAGDPPAPAPPVAVQANNGGAPQP